ncbi:adenylate/guanylate cyclase domain-containing protein [Labilibacter marinus]|uniref:adenylate/guanylate cyclase domain-containing protein n=1 Tax=Labilibacter marinus TaxID=1477105 RepID=UPI0009502F62|nr:adenylate/guanylate cyclase domain-containing protein [Labilibacter marinus]
MEYKYIQRSYLIGWLIASFVWYLTRISMIETDVYFYPQRIIFFLITWLSQGFLYGILFYLITHYITKKVRYYQLLSIAILTQLGTALLIIAILFPILKRYEIHEFPSEFVLFMKSPTVVFGTLYSLIVNTLISTTLSVSLILGKGMLKKIIIGKYYKPIDEERIFMFLDLHDSTKMAEKLGHLAFSMLIQDCFYELAVFNKYKGEIYKYVGDEAIISWSSKDKNAAANCIISFFAFIKILKVKSAYFKSKYGAVPSFKAGIHLGDVTVTEIGKTKREIAYLGDTVNTAARIQGECNHHRSNLLISEDMRRILILGPEYIIDEKGSFLLRGKNEPVKIFAIDLKVNKINLNDE